jgi:thiosulfate/3-mercaptopyruvate sulfurtransferase
MNEQWVMDPSKCATRLGSDNFKVIDCRYSLADFEWGRSEYKNAHIPGAIYAHLDEDLSGIIKPGITGRHPLPKPEDFIMTLKAWGISNDDHIVVYDQSHGGLAARMCWMLQWLGHDKVTVLDGGWAEWQKMGLPESAELPAIEISEFNAEPRPEMVINMREMVEWMDNPTCRIVDARAHKRYTGEDEPIDPVAGHIPGALSMPFLENISEEGRWKSPDELRSRFAEIITTRPENTVVYCGSGVTACHNILALEMAGFYGAKLYPGSWSEWVASGKNPVKKRE